MCGYIKRLFRILVSIMNCRGDYWGNSLVKMLRRAYELNSYDSFMRAMSSSMLSDSSKKSASGLQHRLLKGA